MSICCKYLSLQQWANLKPGEACRRLSKEEDKLHPEALKVSIDVYGRLKDPVEFAFFAKTCETRGVVGAHLWEAYCAAENNCDRLIATIFALQNQASPSYAMSIRSSL